MNKTLLVIIVAGLSVLFGLFAFFFEIDSVSSAEPTPQAHLTPLPSTISGIVSDASGPVAGAIVQIQDTPTKIQTGKNGAYAISGITGTTPIAVTAWSTGHYVGWAIVDPAAPTWTGPNAVNITLKPLPVRDNPEYDGFVQDGVTGSAACGLCHREYKEWQLDAHAHAATNPRFLTMYTGSDVNGHDGQPTQLDGNGVMLPPDLSKAYYGPGFKLDNPARTGNCATCHTPIAGKVSNQQNCAWSGCHMSLTVEQANGVIPRNVSPLTATHGDAVEGINCDFCHKIGDVLVDPKTQMPYPDMPGILSLRMYRPKDDSQQVFFGTIVDVTRPDSYLPLLSQSQFCAGCHFGVFGGVVGMNDVKGGTVIYNAYGEWLASPYSDPKTGQTCQQCHMPVSNANYMVFPDKGGLVRNYLPQFNHAMPGASDQQLLQNAVTVKSTAQRNGDQVQVQISITNDKTGHDVPTDAPMRSVILVVQAQDADGKALALDQGPVNPAYSGNYGGQPGKTFAKVLKDNETGETPALSFWRATTVIEDTRLVAMKTDTSTYTFSVPAGKAATISVQLIYRRAFADLEKQKGWNDPDIIMSHETIQVPAN